MPAWMPIACPMEEPPLGYLKCNGAKFDKEKYPELAMGYSSGVLPDLRGEFIRGWDDGRGVDVGRNILNLQEQSFQSHSHFNRGYMNRSNLNGGNWYRDGEQWPIVGGGFQNIEADYLPSSFVRDTPYSGSNETRPRNVAFLYIVRAA
ncbi:hypothetical protein QQ39_04880 [Pragia fontium]|nr:hypothetical protein QQ39_04880 [Pragia fontium]